MSESMSVRTDDDPDSRALKTGLGLIFWPKPTLIVLGWLGVLFLGWPSKLAIFASLIWLGAHLMFRPSKFGAEIGLAIDAGLQFLKACNAFMARHIEPILKKANAAHHAKRRAREATPAAPMMAFAAASRSADASVAPATSAPAPTRTPRPPVDWLAVLRRWWWIAPVALLAIFAARFVGWATGFLEKPSGREVAAEARTNEAEARERTSEAEVDQSQQATVRVETRYVTVERIVRETETARDAIAAAPDLDARFAVHRDFTQRMRDEAAASRAAAVLDYDSSVDP